MRIRSKNKFLSVIPWGISCGLLVHIALFFTYIHIMSVYNATPDVGSGPLGRSLGAALYGLVAAAWLVGLPLSVTQSNSGSKNGSKVVAGFGVALNILTLPVAFLLQMSFALATA